MDAGGRGLLLLYMGYQKALRGEEVPKETIDFSADGEVVFEDDHDQLGEIKYAYCTEFLIQNLLPEVTDEDINTFRRKLNRIGDCVLVVGDLALVKVHVHTNEPGKALNYGGAMGELVNLKIENMVQQRRDKVSAQAESRKNEPPKASGILAVSVGEGFDAIFRDLGVDQIVEGGQTMNPSIEDISAAIAKINANSVFVFPNNGNVILAAQQAAAITDGKQVYVIPTKTLPWASRGLLPIRKPPLMKTTSKIWTKPPSACAPAPSPTPCAIPNRRPENQKGRYHRPEQRQGGRKGR